MKTTRHIAMVLTILALIAAVWATSCTPVFPFLGKNDAQLGTRNVNEIQPPQVIQSDKPVTIIYPDRAREKAASMNVWQKRFWICVAVLVALQLIGLPVFAWLYKGIKTARRRVDELVRGTEKGLDSLDVKAQDDFKLRMASQHSPDTQEQIKKIKT